MNKYSSSSLLKINSDEGIPSHQHFGERDFFETGIKTRMERKQVLIVDYTDVKGHYRALH